jgi:hypothetical protein
MGAGIVDRFTAIGMRPTVVVERLRSRMPRPSEVRQLRLRPGIPVTVIVRTAYARETPSEDAMDAVWIQRSMIKLMFGPSFGDLAQENVRALNAAMNRDFDAFLRTARAELG